MEPKVVKVQRILLVFLFSLIAMGASNCSLNYNPYTDDPARAYSEALLNDQVQQDDEAYAVSHGGQCEFLTRSELDELLSSGVSIDSYVESSVCEGCIAWSEAPACVEECPSRC